MDNLVKTVKAIRLVTLDGKYLSACEDRKQARCLKRDTNNTSKPDNTVWQVKWLENGKCCLWSIYGTVLAVCGKKNYLCVCQADWPLEYGWAEWDTHFSFSKLNKHEIHLKLSICVANEINVCNYRICDDSGYCYLAIDGWRYRLTHAKWTVEIVDNATIGRNIKKLKVQQQADLHVTNNANKWPQIVLNVNYVNGNYNFSNFNAGQNVNYSGTQTNGYVKFHAPAN